MPTDCEVNIEKIKKFEDPAVTEELNCLQKQLDAYSKGVKRPDPNYIDRTELKDFVERFVPELAKGFDENSKLLFMANTLVFRSPENKMAVKDLGALFNLLREVNFVASNIKPIFDLPGEGYWENRQQVKVLLERLQRSMKMALNRNSESLEETSVDLVKFMTVMLEDQYSQDFYRSAASMKRPCSEGTFG